jgi:hypothetical protein
MSKKAGLLFEAVQAPVRLQTTNYVAWESYVKEQVCPEFSTYGTGLNMRMHLEGKKVIMRSNWSLDHFLYVNIQLSDYDPKPRRRTSVEKRSKSRGLGAGSGGAHPSSQGEDNRRKSSRFVLTEEWLVRDQDQETKSDTSASGTYSLMDDQQQAAVGGGANPGSEGVRPSKSAVERKESEYEEEQYSSDHTEYDEDGRPVWDGATAAGFRTWFQRHYQISENMMDNLRKRHQDFKENVHKEESDMYAAIKRMVPEDCQRLAKLESDMWMTAMDETDPYKLMAVLKRALNKSWGNVKNKLDEKYKALKQAPGQDFATFLEAFEALILEFDTYQLSKSDQEKARGIVQKTLPTVFEKQFVLYYNLEDTELPKYDDLVREYKIAENTHNALEQAKSRVAGEEPAGTAKVLNYADKKPAAGAGGGAATERSPKPHNPDILCHWCAEKGHIMFQCPAKKAGRPRVDGKDKKAKNEEKSNYQKKGKLVCVWCDGDHKFDQDSCPKYKDFLAAKKVSHMIRAAELSEAAGEYDDCMYTEVIEGKTGGRQ